MRNIIFEEPLIVAADRVTDTSTEPIMVPIDRYELGKFVVCAEDNSVKLYGLLWVLCNKREWELDVIKHSYLTNILANSLGIPVRGRTIGGGFLRFDHPNHKIYAGGTSSTTGGVPRSILHSALVMPGYETEINSEETARVVGNPLKDFVSDWYSQHEFVTEEYRP